MRKNFKLSGAEQLESDKFPAPADATILEFWRWAFSDLMSNDIRGDFAEWLVAKLLNLSDSAVRDSWASWDLETTNGVKIEVKTSAFLQTWRQKQPSKIVFSSLRAGVYDEETNTYSRPKTYNADLYVFCLQTETEKEFWNALDLTQWQFYVLLKEQLQKIGVNSISLSSLEKICTPLNAEEFKQRAAELMRRS
jgi:hypothetical protein